MWGGQQREKRECKFTAREVGPNTLLLTTFGITMMIEAEPGRRFGSAPVLSALSAAQGRGRRVLLALVDINPVAAEGGLCPELSSESHQAHVGKGLTLKGIPGSTKARRAPF